jgi:DMSO reductase family type II enzyme heme b subunit
MGLGGRPVHISDWKAAWQESADPVAALRPRMAVDHYPFEAAAPKDRAKMATEYAPARGAHNPSTVRPAGRAVQDLVAEGAGTLAASREQRSEGVGAWENGVWTVTLGRPLAFGGEDAMPVGRRTHVAFAIWEGGAHNTGARKMRSAWLPLELGSPP